MKFLFFLPLLLIGTPLVFAESYRGYDFLDVTNPDGTHTWTGGLPAWILNQNTGEYQPFIQNGNQILTNHGSIILNADGTYSFYKKGIIDSTPLFTDKIVAKYADITNLNSWTYPAALNNDTPEISWDGSQFISSKFKSGVGQLDYKYILNNGEWKTQLEATNLSGLTTKVFGFDQIIDLNRDTIMFGGVQRNLDNFNGVTFDKEFLDANRAKVLNLLNNVSFDFDLGYDNLYSITVYDTGVNSSQLVLDYRMTEVLLPSQTLVIDPTYGYSNFSYGADLQVTATVSTSCSSTYLSKTTGTDPLSPFNIRSDLSNSCHYLMLEWDTTSIPDVAAITQTNIKYDITSCTNLGGRTLYFVNMNSQPSSATTGLVTDIQSPPSYYNAACATGDNQVQTLGADANNRVKALLSSNWFGIGVTLSDMTRASGQNRYVEFDMIGGTPSPQLEITYSLTCAAPTDVIASGQTTTALDLAWTAPSPACVPTGYKVYQSENSAAYTLKATLGNVTSSTISSLNTGTQFEYKISATNAYGDGTNSTIKTTATLPVAPTSLVATPVSKTQIDVDYSDGSQPNVLWFKSRYAPFPDGTWVNFNTNSSVNTPRYENFTGLAEGKYNFQIASGTIGGWGAWSSNATGRTITTTSGTVASGIANIGDVINATATVTITAASPSPVTVSSIDIIMNGTTVQSNPVSQSIADGGSYTFPSYYYLIPDGNPHEYKVQATVSNGTGTVNLISTADDFVWEYDPSYFAALDPAEGNVNYTISRSVDQNEINLKVNREKGGATFQIECLYRTTTEAALNSGGTWHNYTNVGYMNDTLDDAAGQYYYIDCYNDGLLFNVISYTNSSMLLAGIEVFDNTYGTFIGVPVGVFFIVLVAGMANQRTAPMWIVVILAIAGIMSAIGFFTLETNVWALALIAALLGIIVGRKLF